MGASGWIPMHPEAWRTVVSVAWTAACASVALGVLGLGVGALRRRPYLAVLGLTVAALGMLASWPLARESEAVAAYLACRHHVEDIANAAQVYAETGHDGALPGETAEMVPLYLNAIPTCPTAGTDTYSFSYRRSTDQHSMTVLCSGEHHRLGFQSVRDYPRFSSREGLQPPVVP